MEHSVEVVASSLYEAEALGLNAFRSSDFADRISTAAATRLTITVMQPEARHEVRVGDLEDWLRCNGRSPREQALKVRLRQAVADGTWEERL